MEIINQLYKMDKCFVILLLTFATAQATNKDDESTKNSVRISIYAMSNNKWDEQKDEFKAALVQDINTYCRKNAAQCGIVLGWFPNNSDFISGNVVYLTEEKVRTGMNVTMYVTYPSGVPAVELVNNKHVLNKNALEEILELNTDDLNSVLTRDIVGINTSRQKLSPDMQLNWIIIAVVLAVLLMLVIITCCCFWNEKRQEEQAIKEFTKDRQGTNQGYDDSKKREKDLQRVQKRRKSKNDSSPEHQGDTRVNKHGQGNHVSHIYQPHDRAHVHNPPPYETFRYNENLPQTHHQGSPRMRVSRTEGRRIVGGYNHGSVDDNLHVPGRNNHGYIEEGITPRDYDASTSHNHRQSHNHTQHRPNDRDVEYHLRPSSELRDGPGDHPLHHIDGTTVVGRGNELTPIQEANRDEYSRSKRKSKKDKKKKKERKDKNQKSRVDGDTGEQEGETEGLPAEVRLVTPSGDGGTRQVDRGSESTGSIVSTVHLSTHL